jgi:NAD(P)-dependent dehydrogenase (short-subunit alcohol dehydrogenase family)
VRDRSVVVTGAASGIGAAVARRFASAGSRVALLDVDARGAERIAREIEGDAAAALALRCDVSSDAECRSAFGAVERAFGGVDVLVNNAGITHVGLFRDTDLQVLRRVMEVNFFGAVRCTKAALPSLLARRGRIAVVSSVAGFAPLATRSGYAASKHALHGFFGSLRAEHRRDGLGVTLVCPAFVRTRIGSRALGPDGAPAGEDARSGVRRELEPEAVAEALYRGVERGRRLVLLPAEARLSRWLAALWPAAYEWAMRRRTLGPDRRPSRSTGATR